MLEKHFPARLGFEGRQGRVQASSFLYSLATLLKNENMSKWVPGVIAFRIIEQNLENHELESWLSRKEINMK